MMTTERFNERSAMLAAASEYWEQLKTDARSIPGATSTELAKRMDGIAKPSWNDINRLEHEILAALPPERLLRRGQTIRNRYRDVAGDRKYQLYAESKPPSLLELDNTPPNVDAVRADLIELHQELIREYVLGDAIEQQRAHLSRRAARIAVGAFVILGLVLGTSPDASMTSKVTAYASIAVLLAIFAFSVFRPHRSAAGALLLAISIAAVPTFLYAAPQVVTTTTKTDAATPAVTATDIANTDTTKTDKTDTTKTDTTKTDTTKTDTTKTDTTKTDTSKTDTAKQEDKDKKGKKSTTEKSPATTLTMVVIAGVLGGVFSLIRRAQQPVADGDSLRNVEKLAAADSQFYLAPITGAIGALVLYAMFCGKLLAGELFPVIKGSVAPTEGPMTFLDFLYNSGPATLIDHGKVLVWCFIAGFSERLLPDAIDRITSAASQEKK